MAAIILATAALLYVIGLRADRIHAGRTVTERAATPLSGGGSRGDGRPNTSPPARTVARSLTLYRGHSPGYWHWQSRVRTRQRNNAVRYARKLERIIRRSRHHRAPARAISTSSVWDRLGSCESGYGGPANWSLNTGNGFEGGLQFLNSTWIANGGGRYAAHAYDATREQQIEIAERVLAKSGWGQWPDCSAKLGLR